MSTHDALDAKWVVLHLLEVVAPSPFPNVEFEASLKFELDYVGSSWSFMLAVLGLWWLVTVQSHDLIKGASKDELISSQPIRDLMLSTSHR